MLQMPVQHSLLVLHSWPSGRQQEPEGEHWLLQQSAPELQVLWISPQPVQTPKVSSHRVVQHCVGELHATPSGRHSAMLHTLCPPISTQ
jgi:hypothetical protein